MINTIDKMGSVCLTSKTDLTQDIIEISTNIQINDIIREVRVNLGFYTTPFKTHDL
jgi:hypothetical protein